MSNFTSINNPQVETTFINKVFMEDLLLATQMVQFCTPPDNEPTNLGDTARWLHFPEWTVDTSALSQTAADNQINISGTAGATNVDGTMSPYGGYVKVSQFSLSTAPVGTLEKIGKRASDAGSTALDTLAMVQASGTTSTYHCGTGSATLSGINFSSAGTVLKAADIAYTAAYLDTKGCTGFDHLNGMYGGVFHPSAGSHLRAEAATSAGNVTWSEVNKHVAGAMGQEKIMKGDLGALFNVKLFTSPHCYTGSYGPSAAPTTAAYTGWVLAKDGIGCTQIDGDGPGRAQVILKAPGPGDTSQPLDTYNTVGWRWFGVFKLLDSNRVIRVISKQS